MCVCVCDWACLAVYMLPCRACVIVCVCNEARTLPRSLPHGDVVAPLFASFCCRFNSSSLRSPPRRCSRLTVSPLTRSFPTTFFFRSRSPIFLPSLSVPLVLLQLLSFPLLPPKTPLSPFFSFPFYIFLFLCLLNCPSPFSFPLFSFLLFHFISLFPN